MLDGDAGVSSCRIHAVNGDSCPQSGGAVNVSIDLVGVAVGGLAKALVGVGTDTGTGAGVEDLDFTDGSMGSVVRKPRSLMVSFCGFTFCSDREGLGRACWDDTSPPFDSSDELSVPSGVESESNNGNGDRRLLARVC